MVSITMDKLEKKVENNNHDDGDDDDDDDALCSETIMQLTLQTLFRAMIMQLLCNPPGNNSYEIFLAQRQNAHCANRFLEACYEISKKS